MITTLTPGFFLSALVAVLFLAELPPNTTIVEHYAKRFCYG